MAEIQVKQGPVWAEGEYLALATFLPPASAHLVYSAGVSEGANVLDVACGTGVTAITAARAGANVKALDITPDLLAVAEDEAALAQVDIEWQEGDAQELPYGDGEFDIVLSSFGHMFAPDHAATARELIRVTKPGGTIAFTTWPKDSVVGGMLQAVAAVLSPPPPSPLLWGDEQEIINRLGDDVENLRFEEGSVAWPSLSPGHLWHLFSNSYGPFVTALAKLSGEPDKQAELAKRVQKVFEEHLDHNVVKFEFLVTCATKL